MAVRTVSMRAAAFAAAALLTACGGGGGGDDPVAGAPSVPPSAVLTTANAAAASESVVVAGSLADSLGLEFYALVSAFYQTFPVAVGGSLDEVVSEESQAPPPPTARTLGTAIARIANNMLGLDGVIRVRPSATASGRLDCSSGFVDFDVDITDTSLTAPTAGDRIDLDFGACNGFEGIPGFIDGRLVIVIDLLNSNAVQIGVTTTNFSISDGLVSASSNGSLALRFFRNEPRVRIRSASLSIEEDGEVYRVNNFEWIEIPDAFSVEVSGSGNVSSSLIDDEWVAFDIDTPYIAGSLDRYPSSGSILVSGVESSAVRLIILSSIMVRIETDADGDGIFEASEDLLWSEFLPGIE